MIEVSIPNFKDLKIKYLLLDYNGTIALDGRLIPKVQSFLKSIENKVEVFVITADTFMSASKNLVGLATLKILKTTDHCSEKAEFVRSLGAESVIAVGNGRNDAQMLKEAAIGVAVLQSEGLAIEALKSADVLVKDIEDAFAFLISPQKLIATLRK